MRLAKAPRSTRISLRTGGLAGELIEPDRPRAVVLFAHGERARRIEAHNRRMALALADAGLAVFSFDLLDDEEARDPDRFFDIELLTQRMREAIRWAAGRQSLSGLRIGLLAVHTGAAAALRAAALEPETVQAIVCRGGRPDLAGDAGQSCTAAVLFLVAGEDERLLALNALSMSESGGARRMEIIESATHFFAEPGAMEMVTYFAVSWFTQHLIPAGAAAPDGGDDAHGSGAPTRA